MKLYKSDLGSIGHTAYHEHGKLVIICDGATHRIEMIFLREILELFGYRMVSTDDYVYDDSRCDVRIVTDMPWTEYMQLHTKELEKGSSLWKRSGLTLRTE